MNRNSRLLSFILLLSFCATHLHAQKVITNSLEYGTYSVGYQVIHTYDYSRSFFPKYDYYGKRTNYPIGRPMQISMWYPAKYNASSNRMQYEDYLGYTSSEVDFSKNTEQDREGVIQGILESVDHSKRAALKNLLEEHVQAYFEAEELIADFPIIIYAPAMNTSSMDNSIICEYLASKGYVVLAVLAKGEYTELQDFSIRSIHTQADDLAFLLAFAKEKYKSEKIGTLGYSLGGLANIILAMKNKDVDACASLDGSIVSEGWLNDIKESEYYDPENFASNLLIITKNLKNPQLNPATFYDKLRYSNKSFIRYDHNNHAYFSCLGLLYEMLINDELNQTDKRKAYAFYAEITMYVGTFFDRYIKNTGIFKAQATQSYERSFTFQESLAKPPNPNAIGGLIIDKGFDYVDKIISLTLTYDPRYIEGLNWGELQRTSNTLKDNNREEEAIQTLLLSAKAFPDWYLTHYKLGSLYELTGDKQSAEVHYRKALKDNPRHIESINALQAMDKEVEDYHHNRVEDVSIYLGKYIVDSDRYKEIYEREGKLFLATNYWGEEVELWPYSRNKFIVEGDDGSFNLQILFQFDEEGKVSSLAVRGLNSGRINKQDIKE
ncbi:MAG: dienelactone hydrolase family protein [Chitinophagales bacterium]|nr:dienelactone hydrolase family protein [Chitinophagales bacterium]